MIFTRNIGMSVGTSAVTTLIARRTQYRQSDLAEYTRSTRFDVAAAGIASRLTHVGLDMHSARQQALARMYHLVTAQAQALFYIDVYWLLAAMCALMFLLSFFLAKNTWNVMTRLQSIKTNAMSKKYVPKWNLDELTDREIWDAIGDLEPEPNRGKQQENIAACVICASLFILLLRCLGFVWLYRR